MSERQSDPRFYTRDLFHIGTDVGVDETEKIIGLGEDISSIDSIKSKELLPNIEQCKEIVWNEILEDPEFFENISKVHMTAKSVEDLGKIITNEDAIKWRNRKDIKKISNLLFDRVVKQLNIYNLQKGYKPFPNNNTSVQAEKEQNFQVQVFIAGGHQAITFSLTLDYDYMYGYDCQSIKVVNVDQYTKSVYS
ncbi:MAG: hypothetical protein COX80_04165 [Candidatus Magasanikbacteria bacterium CG_4_10_14_0_2_um_filter_33_14]|uniref:Uncharacterized protein n=1 Tax=Candidatus Magasanikbacteria bacterium CG_4_10_14_0_2_um_filter_33_14 TaxID=1974636 RepID=A0A2M7V9I8_9BACT|nr:MAG: hypothetical protein COX80_04165 [Candidatus Magasanikbacteria bacterium CG_4_10_14_0_2_um_filter_33_14]